MLKYSFAPNCWCWFINQCQNCSRTQSVKNEF